MVYTKPETKANQSETIRAAVSLTQGPQKSFSATPFSVETFSWPS